MHAVRLPSYEDLGWLSQAVVSTVKGPLFLSVHLRRVSAEVR